MTGRLNSNVKLSFKGYKLAEEKLLKFLKAVDHIRDKALIMVLYFT